MDIKTISLMTNKAQIPTFTGKVTKVYDRTVFTGQFGESSSQRGYVEDATGKMVIEFKGFDDMKVLEGQTLTFSQTDTKHGKKGIEVNEWESKTTGKKGKTIRVTPSCKIQEANMEQFDVDFPPEEGSVSVPKPAPDAQNEPLKPRLGVLVAMDIPKSMVVSYKKDILVALLGAGVEPVAAVEMANKCYEGIAI